MRCTDCEQDLSDTPHVQRRSFMYGSEEVWITDYFYHCPKCHTEWSADDFDLGKAVYDAYLAKHMWEEM